MQDIIKVIHSWIENLRYPEQVLKCIRPYHLAILKWDKNLIVQALNVAKEYNTKYIILVVIDTYNIGIINSNIKLII